MDLYKSLLRKKVRGSKKSEKNTVSACAACLSVLLCKSQASPIFPFSARRQQSRQGQNGHTINACSGRSIRRRPDRNESRSDKAHEA